MSFGPPHPLAKFVVFLVKDKGAPILAASISSTMRSHSIATSRLWWTGQPLPHARLGATAGKNAAADLLGVPVEPYQQKNYVTCLDLGSSGAVFTRGWDRQIELTGDKAKATKREINAQWIYPPLADRAMAFAAAEWARAVD